MLCPNCKSEMIVTDNGMRCSKCVYSISNPIKPSGTGKGSKYVQEVNRVIKDMLVESRLSGDKVPWKQPWIVIPKRNYDSNRIYNGLNRWLLSYSDDVSFITAKAVEKKGLKVKEGAKLHTVIAWIPAKLKKDELKLSEDEQKKLLKKRFPIMVTHLVYKSKDVEGLPEKHFESDKINNRFEDIEAFIKSTGVDIKIGGNRACYNSITDCIMVPRLEQFEDSKKYYQTLFHELGHASGHKSRLNRDADKFKALEAYSKEELIAEMAGAYMCMVFGIEPTENTVAYIDSWLSAIESDPYLLVSAGAQAEKVLEYFKLV